MPENSYKPRRESGDCDSTAKQIPVRANYHAPRIMSAQKLELAASGGCDDGSFGFGKTLSLACTTLGS